LLLLTGGGTTTVPNEQTGGALSKKDGALAGAAVSAAVAAAAVYGLRKAHSENGRPRSIALVMTALESASDSLLPLAEAAAEEVGRWAAKNSPGLVRDRLLPRFIEAFREAA
jgi:hypothetical protein